MAKAGMKRPDPKGQQSKESEQVLRIRSRLHTGDRVQPQNAASQNRYSIMNSSSLSMTGLNPTF